MLSLNCSEICTYKKIHFELNTVQNVLVILLKKIIKIRNNRFYKNFCSNNCIMLPDFNTLFGNFLEEKRNIGNTSENIKCGHLKKLDNLPY